MLASHGCIAAFAAIALFSIGRANAQLHSVGPVSPHHGFPTFYRAADQQQLAPCLTSTDLCLLDAAADLLQPGLPFPLNYGGVFPSHVFYNAAEATMTTNGGGLALLVMALQGGFANDSELPIPGDQFVMGRLRLRVDNLVPGANYHITTPYGEFDLVAENGGRRGINFTIDVPGPIAGAFAGALTGPIGPTFLRWDSDLPIVDGAGNHYVGNPAIEHTITGSPYGTNYFRIDGPHVGGTNIHSLQTNLFSVIGLVDGAAPVADFTASTSGGPAPLQVQFADHTAGAATSWSWSFGDGGSSNQQNPTHLYTVPGTYTVSLTATGVGGSNTRTIAGLITVTPPPVVLSGPTPVLGAHEFTVSGVTAGSDVYLLLGRAAGNAGIALGSCTVATGLQRPTILVRRRADAGEIRLRAKLSASMLGLTLPLQAVDAGACKASNVLTVEF